jgi:glycosyltransferase involved in cell wall biosynthesis
MPARLSILFPTYRFDALARQNIAAAAMTGDDAVQVLIGDNSANPEKWRYLNNIRELSRNVQVFCHAENLGANNNYRYLLDRAEGEWCCLAADDDVFTPDYFHAGAAILAAEPGTSAAAGLLVGFNPASGGGTSQLYRAVSRTEATALERISAYDAQNMLPYALARRDSVIRMARYVDDTPLPAAFMDFIGAYALLAEGKFRTDENRPIYLYMNNNWSDATTAFKSSASYYIACGLPERFQYFHGLAWAIAALHFFLSTYRPSSLGSAEAEQIARFLYERYIAYTRADLARNAGFHLDLLGDSRVARAAILECVADQPPPPARCFSRFLLVLTAFSPELARRYGDFLATTLIDPLHRPDSADDRRAEPRQPPPVRNETVPQPSSEPDPELERLRAQVRALESSTSWRLTAPLRLMARTLTGRRD